LIQIKIHWRNLMNLLLRRKKRSFNKNSLNSSKILLVIIQRVLS
jgi:hypothetical protein